MFTYGSRTSREKQVNTSMSSKALRDTFERPTSQRSVQNWRISYYKVGWLGD